MNENTDTSNSEHSIGVIYLAFGYGYCIQTIRSVFSLKSTHPELDVTIVTNIPLNEKLEEPVSYNGTKIGPEIFDEVIYIDDDVSSNRQYKTSINDYSKYDKTLFLDCDTVIERDIAQGFHFLDYFDLAAVSRPMPSPYMTERWDGDLHIPNVNIRDSPTFYSGAFFFNTASTNGFFNNWERSFNKFGYDHDQYSFAHSIYKTDIQFLPLPIVWNTMDSDISRYNGYDDEYEFEDQIKIHHQNRSSLEYRETLCEVDSLLGDEILDVGERERDRIREQFREDYDFSYQDRVKNLLSNYYIVRKAYSLVSNMV